MPAYKFKTCIIDGQEQYAVSPADCKDHPPETRSIQFPESLLSFVDIEMHTIAPLISDISDGVRCLSDEQRSADINKVLHALDALADHHIYFEVFRQEWAGRIAQSQSAGPLQKRWQQGTRHMVEDLVGIQCQIKYLFSRVLDIDGEGGPVPEKMISYARTDSSFQFRPQTTHYEIWNDAAFAEVLYPEFMYDLISYHIQECVKRELRFRICKNCGRYFCITGRRTAVYCHRSFGRKGGACNGVGPVSAWTQKSQKDEVLMGYRREYKRRFAWINAGKISKNDFYAWTKLAREKKKECDSGTIPCKSFFAWLRQS